MGTVQGIYPWVSTLVMGSLMGRRFWVGRGCFFLGGVVGPGEHLCTLLEVWVLGVGMSTLGAQTVVHRGSGTPSTDDPGANPTVMVIQQWSKQSFHRHHPGGVSTPPLGFFFFYKFIGKMLNFSVKKKGLFTHIVT
jgi:hypothetical protein